MVISRQYQHACVFRLGPQLIVVVGFEYIQCVAFHLLEDDSIELIVVSERFATVF